MCRGSKYKKEIRLSNGKLRKCTCGGESKVEHWQDLWMKNKIKDREARGLRSIKRLADNFGRHDRDC